MRAPITITPRSPILSVPESLRNTVAEMRNVMRGLGAGDPMVAIRWYLDQVSGRLGWNAMDRRRFEAEAAFAFHWVNSGAHIFSLTHSMAALLSTTRSPPLHFDRLPHRAFLVEVPSAYLPMRSDYGDRATRFVGIQCDVFKATPNESGPRQGSGIVLAIPDGDTLSNVVEYLEGRPIEESLTLGTVADADDRRGLKLAIRLASNVIAYVTEHRAGMKRKTKLGIAPVITEIGTPPGVVVDREFRDLAAAIVAARDTPSARRALAHMVRGHWRNQATGIGRVERRLTWVRPHRRGDPAIGSIVQKTSRVREPLN